jgi:hypothetical protein
MHPSQLTNNCGLEIYSLFVLLYYFSTTFSRGCQPSIITSLASPTRFATLVKTLVRGRSRQRSS